MKRINIFIFIIISMFAYSCEESDINNLVDNTKPNILVDTLNLANNNNSYDYIGKFHNDGINYLESNFSNVNCINFIEQIKLNIVSFANQQNQQIDTLFTYSFIDSLFNVLLTNPNIILLDTILNHYSFTETIKYEISSIIDTILSYDLNHPLYGLIQKIKVWENYIINFEEFTQDEKNKLLIFGATCRYSLKYWFTLTQLNENPWSKYLSGCNFGQQSNVKNLQHKILIFGFESYPLWYKIVAVAISDAAGAAEFGWIGGIVASAVTAAVVFCSD